MPGCLNGQGSTNASGGTGHPHDTVLQVSLMGEDRVRYRTLFLTHLARVLYLNINHDDLKHDLHEYTTQTPS